jgi:hypothetical protein
MESEETSIARQRLGKQVSAATDTQAPMQNFGNDVFSSVRAKQL